MDVAHPCGDMAFLKVLTCCAISMQWVGVGRLQTRASLIMLCSEICEGP